MLRAIRITQRFNVSVAFEFGLRIVEQGQEMKPGSSWKEFESHAALHLIICGIFSLPTLSAMQRHCRTWSRKPVR